MLKIKQKKAQEEMLGFALIVIIVSIAIIFLLFLFLRSDSKQGVESYEVNSFIQTSLHYTTECKEYSGYVDVRKLIFKCVRNEHCQGGEDPCEMLNDTLRGIIEKSWPYGENRPIKGYFMNILDIVSTDETSSRSIVDLKGGNETNNYKGSSQDFTVVPYSIRIYFRTYY
ncbi:hypothetical protein K0A97_01505 [Patescibacteria group bacterium]|nr:hypothetical protein [Patescibacteria group bacterium]